jgi:hypothetical protein
MFWIIGVVNGALHQSYLDLSTSGHINTQLLLSFVEVSRRKKTKYCNN